jgi:hypothetical protein
VSASQHSDSIGATGHLPPAHKRDGCDPHLIASSVPISQRVIWEARFAVALGGAIRFNEGDPAVSLSAPGHGAAPRRKRAAVFLMRPQPARHRMA